MWLLCTSITKKGMDSDRLLILVTRQPFKMTIPGKLCQSVDLFEQVMLVSFSRKNCGNLRNFDLTWSAVSPEFNCVTVFIKFELENLFKKHFFHYFEFPLAISSNLVNRQQMKLPAGAAKQWTTIILKKIYFLKYFLFS